MHNGTVYIRKYVGEDVELKFPDHVSDEEGYELLREILKKPKATLYQKWDVFCIAKCNYELVVEELKNHFDWIISEIETEVGHKCDPRCQDAQGDICVCACMGLGHGSGIPEWSTATQVNVIQGDVIGHYKAVSKSGSKVFNGSEWIDPSPEAYKAVTEAYKPFRRRGLLSYTELLAREAWYRRGVDVDVR